MSASKVQCPRICLKCEKQEQQLELIKKLDKETNEDRKDKEDMRKAINELVKKVKKRPVVLSSTIQPSYTGKNRKVIDHTGRTVSSFVRQESGHLTSKLVLKITVIFFYLCIL